MATPPTSSLSRLGRRNLEQISHRMLERYIREAPADASFYFNGFGSNPYYFQKMHFGAMVPPQ